MNRKKPAYQPQHGYDAPWRWLLGLLLFWCSSAFAFDADDYLWQSRLLLIAASSPDDPEVVNLRDVLGLRSDAVIDRDLVVIQLYETGPGMIDDELIPNEESRHIRMHYGLVPGEKSLVLVGKDGEVKRRSPLTIDLASVFEQIDAMPMRRQEIRSKTASNQLVTPARE